MSTPTIFWRANVGISTSESKGFKTIMNIVGRIRNENVHHGQEIVVAALEIVRTQADLIILWFSKVKSVLYVLLRNKAKVN